MKQSKVETRYYKIKMNKGETKFEFHKYATAKVTPMHERIRTHYPAETVFGNVIQQEGLWGFFVVEKTIASDDWQWAKAAAQKLIKEKRKKTLIQPQPLS